MAFALLGALSLAGCPSKPDHVVLEVPLQATTPRIDDLVAQTSKSGQAILLLVAESGASPEDDTARSLFATTTTRSEHIVRVLLDISVSRNRAEATRLHVPESPVLFGLSSRGVIVRRDEKPITADLILRRMKELEVLAPEADAELGKLEKTLTAESNDPTAQLAVADFLLTHHNDHEAIPHLEAVAHATGVDAPVRVRAWVDLARAHLWIAEPEKARHESNDLIEALGSTQPEAIAGANLVLATHDTTGKRFKLARQELETALAAAPASNYAKEAREALAKLPPETSQ